MNYLHEVGAFKLKYKSIHSNQIVMLKLSKLSCVQLYVRP